MFGKAFDQTCPKMHSITAGDIAELQYLALSKQHFHIKVPSVINNDFLLAYD